MSTLSHRNAVRRCAHTSMHSDNKVPVDSEGGMTRDDDAIKSDLFMFHKVYWLNSILEYSKPIKTAIHNTLYN